MTIPFLDLRAQYLELKTDIDAAVLRALDSGWYILGKECERFENAFRQYLTGSNEGFVVGVNSGTDAIKLALLAAGVSAGDEVITVANTAIPTATAICSIGAVPVFCDVDPDTWLLDAGRLDASVTEKTRAIVPVHLYGAACAMDAIGEIAGRRGIAVIEDTAQATGARYRGDRCGTIGDFGAFSFYPSKNLGACGDGGAIFVRSEKRRETLAMLRNYGQRTRYKADRAGGENSRLDELQAAILNAKLGHVDRWMQQRQELVDHYRGKIRERNLPLRMQQEHPGGTASTHLFVVKLAGPAERDALMTFLQESGIQTLVHYPYPLTEQPAFARYKRGALPVCEDLCSSILSLPLHQYLSFADIDVIIAVIEDFFRRR